MYTRKQWYITIDIKLCQIMGSASSGDTTCAAPKCAGPRRLRDAEVEALQAAAAVGRVGWASRPSCVYIYIYTHTCVCMYVCMYVCM